MSETTITGKTNLELRDTEYTISVKAQLIRTREGHDADGNRSWPVECVEDVEITDIDPVPSEDDLKEIETFVEDLDVDEFEWED